MKKLYSYQYAFIVMLSCLCNLFMIGIVEGHVGTGAWTAFLLCIPLGLVVCTLYASAVAHGTGTLAETNIQVFGRVAGNVVTLIYALFFLFSGAVLLSWYGLYAVGDVLGKMDVLVFSIPVMLAVVYTARKGTLAVGRMAFILGTVMLASMFIAAVTELFSGHVENLFPIFGVSQDTLFRVVFALSMIEYAQLGAAMTFLPETEDRARQVRTSLFSILAGNGLIALFSLGSVLVRGQTTDLNHTAYFSNVRAGDFSDVVNGLQILAVAAFFFATVFRLTVNVMAACGAAGGVFGMHPRKLAPVAGILIVIAARVLFADMRQAEKFLLGPFPLIILGVMVALPLLQVILAAFRRK